MGKLLDLFHFSLQTSALDGVQCLWLAQCVRLYMYGHFPHNRTNPNLWRHANPKAVNLPQTLNVIKPALKPGTAQKRRKNCSALVSLHVILFLPGF